MTQRHIPLPLQLSGGKRQQLESHTESTAIPKGWPGELKSS